MPKTISMFDIAIDNVSMAELMPKLKFGGVVFTPNVDHVMRLRHDVGFRDVYRSATYRTCDSQVLMYASRLLGKPLVERISGSDLFPAFCEHYAADEDVKVFLLGAMEGVAAIAQERINSKVGREMVVGVYSPPFGFEHDEAECDRIIEMIEASGANVLALGLGTPKQERWIYSHKDRFNQVKLFLAIGATIDFEAGNVQRAPKWVSDTGLEWMYRLLREPRRLWKRYILHDLPFIWVLLEEFIKSKRQPTVERAGSPSN
ncbi:MAG: WecB/TagA/CpsF family glycosyltransferase [Cyanothece sp. SIO2G6]|nr:WecB/TagA/CpsF family glycosyltransferase [Cyanothece sp. SIO2G6]